jgi:hypothetical protein
VTPRRAKHPKKDVEQALRFAEENGWLVRSTARGYRWGEMICGHAGPDRSRISMLSTPTNPGKHANRLRRKVRNCPHQLRPEAKATP